MKRVIAYTMHETEVRAAMERLTNPARTPGYIMGEADDQSIRRLRRDGLAVEIVGEAGEGRERAPVTWPRENAALLPARPLSPLRGVRKAAKKEGGARGARKKSTGATRTAARDTKVANYEVSVAGPLVHAWRETLEREGANRIGERLVSSTSGRPTYLLRLTRAAAANIARMDFVTRVAAYEPSPVAPAVMRTPPAPPPPRDGGKSMRGAPPTAKKGGGAVRKAARGSEANATSIGTARFEILLPIAELREAALAAIRKSGVHIHEQGQRKLRVDAKATDPILTRLRSEFRAQVSPYVKPRKHLDLASSLVGVGPAATRTFPFQGTGQLIGIADTGIDATHPDLKDRILQSVALGRARRTDDPDGHGTHVAGIAVGTGKASRKQFQGAAPKAKLYFQSLLDRDGDLGGLPLELAKLFQPAYQAGVRIHNNSWGTLTRSRYTVSSYEVDEYVASHPDFLVVVSAGNAGSAADPVDGQPRNAKRGFVDWRSIDAPASCKNALVVGASRSSRTEYGYAAMRHADVWADDFRYKPMSDETVSGDPEALAGFSSRGPCDDGRIKPDLLAPGTDIVAPRSAQADCDNFWSCYPPNERYAVMGGTSMAAPLVAGCAALVREYYVTKRKHEPSAALLKATLVNGTRWLTGRDAVADHAGVPNYHQGFGGVHMPSTVPTAVRPFLGLAFDDTWTDADWQFSQAGEAVRYTFDVADAADELRVCLTWTDAPGRSLQNLLGLLLEAPVANGRSAKMFGNQDRRKNIQGADMENNVQIIRVSRPVAGRYTLQVWAHEIVHPSQAYALVVTGALASMSLTRSVVT